MVSCSLGHTFEGVFIGLLGPGHLEHSVALVRLHLLPRDFPQAFLARGLLGGHGERDEKG